MPICNKDALLVIDQIIKSFLSTILQTFFGFFSDNKKMGIISNFKGKLHFCCKCMDSLDIFGEILTNSIKIFQFLSFLGNFDNCDDYDNLRYLETPKKSASAQIFLHSSPFIHNNPTIKQAVKT